MSAFTDALEPAKKGILTKARENYERATTIRGLIEQVKKYGMGYIQDAPTINGLNSLTQTEFQDAFNSLPKHLKMFLALHEQCLETGFYLRVTAMFNEAERDGIYPPMLCRYGRHLVKEILSSKRTLMEQRQFYDALMVLLTFLGKIK